MAVLRPKCKLISKKLITISVTTIRPQIGTVEYKDYRQVTVADLPGLIEGAHMNVGKC